MKTINKLSFGFKSVQAGQKSATVNALPQLIANSTPGKFVITAPVSKALGIAVGENVMFFNNISDIENAIMNGNEELVAWAAENNVDITTREGQDIIVKEFATWGIAKGFLKYTKAGEPIMSNERLTKEDKQKYFDANVMTIVAENRDALVAEYGEMSDEELASKLTPEMIEYPKYHVAEGSKTSTTSIATGVGCQLSFTDSAIWGALKADLGEEATKKNRIYNVLLKDAQKITVNNGYENVEIVVLPIAFKEDADVMVRKASK